MKIYSGIAANERRTALGSVPARPCRQWNGGGGAAGCPLEVRDRTSEGYRCPSKRTWDVRFVPGHYCHTRTTLEGQNLTMAMMVIRIKIARTAACVIAKGGSV
jgi:hypothetical protein